MQFAKYAANYGYVESRNGELRLSKDDVYKALVGWLSVKIIDQPHPFGWKGYSLTLQNIETLSAKTNVDWKNIWLS